ncbi:MAG: hypothetical protein R6W87_09185 [Halospina sp.]
MNEIMNQLQDLNDWINHGNEKLENIQDRRGRLSDKSLNEQGFAILVRNRFDPYIYPRFRELKIRAEKDVRYENIDSDYLDSLTERAGSYQPKNLTDLSKQAPSLYREIIKSGYSIWVSYYLNLSAGQLRLWHLPDQFLLDLAKPYGNFTDLHNCQKDLRRHIKARGLDEALIRLAPDFGRHFYIGLGDRRYRSLAELVAGNILELSGVRYEGQHRVLLKNRQGRPRYADFYLPDVDLVIEVEQCTSGNRGSRRDGYVERTKAKYKEYEAENIHYITIDSDLYYSSYQGFKTEEFANDLQRRILGSTNLYIPIPSTEKMTERQVSEDIAFVLNGSEKEVYLHITEEMGIDSIAELQNHNSPILKALKQRPDKGEAVLATIKSNSIQRRNRTMTKIHEMKRDEYAHLSEVKKVVQKKNIRSQRDWFSWCTANPEEKARLRIPTNVYSVYRRKGQWVSWTDFFTDTQI